MAKEREQLVLVRVEDGVGVISLNRPHRHNALTDEFSDAIHMAIDAVYANAEVRVVLLRGEGKSFCSGRDLAVLGSSKAAGARRRTTYEGLRLGEQRQLTIMNSKKPSICAMRGYSVGAGFELALACDMRVAATNSHMWLPEIRMSVLPDLGGAHILASVAGSSRAKYIAMTGDRVDAQRALAWGIVDFVVDDTDIDAF
jgi:enoyl-CoA hydratase/carnithine racemase